ncbi:MAG: hypothetical protein ACRDU8_01530 [Egibacteraceae bacterium]
MCTDTQDGWVATIVGDGVTAKRRPDRTFEAREVAAVLAETPENRVPHVGFCGYGDTAAGDRILIAVDSSYEAAVAETMAGVLRGKGATVDVLTVDVGPDRPFRPAEEREVTIRDVHWTKAPRRWEGLPWIEDLAAREGYDLLIHGKGGPTPATDYRYEQFPWLRTEHLEQGAAVFPQDLHRLVNETTWDKIWRQGRGGVVRLTDPEGTDLSWTLHSDYYDGSRRGFNEAPVRNYGHLHGHPPTPAIEQGDATGVIAGTTSHVGEAFPQIRLHLDGGRIERISGGGAYGDAWREVLEATRHNQYPCFPREGLFWLWEIAIGTNPWIRRPSNVRMLSSGGFEWERRRSGVIHAGLGTRWRGPEEAWAAERRMTYGHMHVHLLFATYEITTADRRTVKVIDHGRLTALDDPAVRSLADDLGGAESYLSEAWTPDIPGISVPGDYADYARDPGAHIYAAS